MLKKAILFGVLVFIAKDAYRGAKIAGHGAKAAGKKAVKVIY